jgi:ketosteroid isomerase-like protein
MKSLIVIVVGAVALSAGASSVAEQPKPEQEVLAAMETWRQAMMKKDRAALEQLYHADLSYGHSNGQIESRAEAVKNMVESKTDYTEVDLTDTKVRVNGNIATVHGKVHFKQVNGSEATDVNLVVLHVWMKGPQGWRMIGRQSTRQPQ